MLHHTRNLCSFYLSFVFKTFVSTPKKKEVFPPELRLKFVLSHHFASLHLCTFIPSLYFILPTPFTLSHCSEPPSCTISHSSILHQETISLLQNCTPQNHIGYTLRSPISTDLCHIHHFGAHHEGAFQNWSLAFARPTCSVPPIPSPKPQLHTWHCTQHHIPDILQHRPPSFQPPLGP